MDAKRTLTADNSQVTRICKGWTPSIPMIALLQTEKISKFIIYNNIIYLQFSSDCCWILFKSNENTSLLMSSIYYRIINIYIQTLFWS